MRGWIVMIGLNSLGGHLAGSLPEFVDVRPDWELGRRCVPITDGIGLLASGQWEFWS